MDEQFGADPLEAIRQSVARDPSIHDYFVPAVEWGIDQGLSVSEIWRRLRDAGQPVPSKAAFKSAMSRRGLRRKFKSDIPAG